MFAGGSEVRVAAVDLPRALLKLLQVPLKRPLRFRRLLLLLLELLPIVRQLTAIRLELLLSFADLRRLLRDVVNLPRLLIQRLLPPLELRGLIVNLLRPLAQRFAALLKLLVALTDLCEALLKIRVRVLDPLTRQLQRAALGAEPHFLLSNAAVGLVELAAFLLHGDTFKIELLTLKFQLALILRKRAAVVLDRGEAVMDLSQLPLECSGRVGVQVVVERIVVGAGHAGTNLCRFGGLPAPPAPAA